MKAYSFVCRFGDAIRGFRLFNYPSILFDQDANFSAIKLYELADGTVSIENTNIPKTNQPSVLHAERDFDYICSIAVQYHKRERPDLDQTFIRFDSDSQAERVLCLQQPDGDYDITIARHALGILVMRA